MALLVAWVVFPAVLLALCAGCGLLAERAAGLRLPGALTCSVGLAVMIVATQACVARDATAELALPLVLVLAVAGFALGRERLSASRPDGWALGAGLAVFAVFAAPVFLSGDPTFAGYGVLGDTSIHFILIDRLMEHGRDLSGLPPSSYRSALDGYFAGSYPTGAHTALGAVRPLVGQDVAWIFQPYLAFLAALTAAALYELARFVVPSRAARAGIAFVAAQPALVYAYSLQGSIKEIATVWVLAVLVTLVPVAVERRTTGLRRLVPLAVTTAAGIEILGLAIAPWLGPLLLACLVALLWLRGRAGLRTTAIEAAAFAGATALLALPFLERSRSYVTATESTVTAQEEFGNLFGPLRDAQAFGIWPSGDYRVTPDAGDFEVTYVLIGLAIGAALLGLAWCVRRRAWLPLLFAGVSAIGWAYATSRGSPWVDGKALMILSGPVMFIALLGPVALWRSGRGPEAAILAAALAGGVLWSNALAYHDVSLAPRDRLEELADVGDRLAGRGPSLYVEFEEYGKHFLREGDPTGWTEAWQPGPANGPFATYQDIDQVPADFVQRHRTLVLRRSPVASRPPSPYRRVRQGRYYEVWERPASGAPRVVAHLPLGDASDPAARPRCADVRRVAAAAGNGGRLAFVEREQLPVANPARGPLPRSWGVDTRYPESVRTIGAGVLERSVKTRSGPAQVWLGGSIGRPVSVALDGRSVGSVEYELNGPGQFVTVGEATAGGGETAVRVTRGGGNLRPGNGGDYSLVGPVVAVPDGAGEAAVRTVAPSRWRELCGRRLDWIEAVTD